MDRRKNTGARVFVLYACVLAVAVLLANLWPVRPCPGSNRASTLLTTPGNRSQGQGVWYTPCFNPSGLKLSTHRSHPSVDRSLSDYTNFQAPFLPFFEMLDSASSVLEVGAGDGHTAIELKSRAPQMHVDATNKASSNWAHLNQSKGSQEELWSAARHYNVPLFCDKQGQPMLPNIINADGFASPNYFAALNRTYDLVISRHALNNGKIRPTESCMLIPQVLDLLKPEGGTALLHLLWDAFIPSNNSAFMSIAFLTVYSETHKQNISLYFYQTYCGHGASCVNMLVRRGPVGVPARNPKSCLIPYDDWVDAPMGSRPQTHIIDVIEASLKHNLSKSKQQMYTYSLQYMHTLLGSVEAWYAAKAIPSLQKNPEYACTHHQSKKCWPPVAGAHCNN